MKNTEFLDKIEWLHKYYYERYKLIALLINATRYKKKITISKDVNVDAPALSITIDKKYMYKHQCNNDDEANMIIDIAIALNKQI